MRKIIENYSVLPKDLFKRIFVTFLFGYLPLAILHITLNVAGIIPVNFNNKQVYGLEGILIIILFIPFVVLLITFFVWLYFIFGNLIIRILKRVFYE
ncbi:MAG: hypothetical protein J7574_09435 [Flavobacterium sp.]|uniref:hypothetical protein n=1 Tax=Flavobacterium sp. TaxID=239 RepID=UPI001B1AA667|nr:hypothetical protein [Flavobacterium sp.]MBO9584367.1 hypothetical protein [Flavobacterium sp.]